MSTALPINLDDLLHYRCIESSRVELKATWDSKVTPGQVVRTVCAFANDFQNLNGGYILIGVEESDGVAVLPPRGLPPDTLDAIQQEVRGICNRMDPPYVPRMSPEIIDGRMILVLWVPASDIRPYRAPVKADAKSDLACFIREGSQNIKAQKGAKYQQLLSSTASVPFDDRPALEFTLEDLRSSLVREFLKEIRSALLQEQDDAEIYRQWRLSKRVNGHEVPRNVALLMFSDEPEKVCTGARIEVVRFSNEAGDSLTEMIFKGPLLRQVRDCLRYLQSELRTFVRKRADKAEADGWSAYPLAAIEEAINNAIYHRSYEYNPEPIKIYLFPDRIEVINYPGPVPGIKQEHFQPGKRVPPVPARNRRIGEFLKEARLAEARGTGIPKLFDAMVNNGSPLPRFEFNDEYFSVTLPLHPGAISEENTDAGRLDLLLQYDTVIKGTEKSGGRRIKIPQRAAPAPPADLRLVPIDPFAWRLATVEIEGAIRTIDPTEVEELRLFVAAPYALAAWAGRMLDQYLHHTKIRIFQRLRSVEGWLELTSQSPSAQTTGIFLVEQEKVTDGCRATLLVLEGQASISLESQRRIAEQVDADSIWRVRFAEDSMDLTPENSSGVLNEIGRALGRRPEGGPEILHVVSSAPVSFMVELGRVLRPTIYQKVLIYQLDPRRRTYHPVLDLITGEVVLS